MKRVREEDGFGDIQKPGPNNEDSCDSGLSSSSPSTGQLDNPSTKKKQSRTREHSIACEECRARKRKCDRKTPCGSCIDAKQSCHYRNAFRRGPSAGWSQQCLERALEMENAFHFLLCIPSIQEDLLIYFQSTNKDVKGASLPNIRQSREPAQLSIEWAQDSVRTLEEIVRLSYRIKTVKGENKTKNEMVSNGSPLSNLNNLNPTTAKVMGKDDLYTDAIHAEVRDDNDFW